MTQNLPVWFTKKFETAVEQRYQQRDRRLAGAVSGGTQFIGDYAYFPRMGTVEMYDSPRFAQIALANAAMDWISLQAKPKFVLLGVWDPDKNKLSIDVANEYGIACANAGMRAEDRLIVDALNNAAVNGVTTATTPSDAAAAQGSTTENIVTLGDYNTTLDLDLVANGLAQLMTVEAFEGEDIIFVQPGKLKMNQSLDPLMYMSTVKGAELPWSQLQFRNYERLYGNSGTAISQGDGQTGVDTYLFARSAVVSGYNDEMNKINDRIPGALTNVMGNWFQAGATVRDAKGVIRLKSKYNITLARHSMPVVTS